MIQDAQRPEANSDFKTVGSNVGLVWRKSSRSADQGACVEVAFPEGAAATRDSKDPSGDMLLFRRRAWAQFLAATARGAFDRM